MADIKFFKKNNIFDIEFAEGDVILTQGMDTALLMSFFGEVRATEGEAGVPEFRGGWWGNLFDDINDYEYGSKLWLLSSAANTDNTANRAVTYTQEAFKWITDRNLASQIDVSATRTPSNIEIVINILKDDEIIDGSVFNLWENTYL